MAAKKKNKNVLDKFTLPKGETFVLLARYIPAYMGANNPPFMQFYHKTEDMIPDIERLERNDSVNDIVIARVVMEHKNVYRRIHGLRRVLYKRGWHW